MRKIVSCGWVLTFSMLLLLSSVIFTQTASAVVAYDWKIPNNVRIVQKDNFDGVKTFNTIQAAINSIVDSSATNPYTIKVMPGVYNETINIPGSYINIVGAGETSTVIEGITCDGSNITVSDLKVSPSTGWNDAIHVNGNLVLKNVTVDITQTSQTGIYGSNTATVRIYSSSIVSSTGGLAINYRNNQADLIFADSTIEMSSGISGMDCIGIMASNPVISNSKIHLNSWRNYAVMVEGGVGRISGSEIIVIGTSQDDQIGVRAYGSTSAEILSSKISVTGAASSLFVAVDAPYVTVDSSVVTSSGNAFDAWYSGDQAKILINNSSVKGDLYSIHKKDAYRLSPTYQFFVGGSKLVGTTNGVAGLDVIINTYDGNYQQVTLPQP